MSKLIYIAIIFSAISCGSPHEYEPLVHVSEIDGILKSGEKCQVIDLRPEEEYEHAHIPSAVNLWRSDIQDEKNEIPGMRIQKEDLEELLSIIGFDDEKQIFIYDAKGNVDAARLWWILSYYGFEKVSLIDGGFVKWRMEGLNEEEGRMVLSEKTNFKLRDKNREELLVNKEDLIAHNFDQIIDTRTLDEYQGKFIKNQALRPGHIPGSLFCDYFNLINGGEFTLKSKEKLLNLLNSKGIDPDKSTATYCHSGVRSALVTFALKEIIGMENVANYDGSWIEWSHDEDLPAETILTSSTN